MLVVWRQGLWQVEYDEFSKKFIWGTCLRQQAVYLRLLSRTIPGLGLPVSLYYYSSGTSDIRPESAQQVDL